MLIESDRAARQVEWERLGSAMFETSFPCNPLPFLAGILDYVRCNGTDSIRDDDAKRMLWIVLAQSYGQLASIDLTREYVRLGALERVEAAS